VKSKYDRSDVTRRDGEFLTVLGHQARVQEELGDRLEKAGERVEEAIGSSEALLRALGRSLPSTPPPGASIDTTSAPLRSWEEIASEAEAAVGTGIQLHDLLSVDDICRVEERVTRLRGEFEDIHRLDAIDWAIAGVAGSLAALVDTFLVKMPSSPGMLGGAGARGGGLSNFMRARLRAAHSPEEIRELEERFWVPYDAAHSGQLHVPVAGLGARTHRFQSLGHDPLLGFIFGVADILRGGMTAIDARGRVVSQVTDSAPVGMSIFEAVAVQFGHLRSDVSTPGGLPAPLMPLLQLIQVGRFGKGGYTLGQVSRQMYRSGYDFGHFLAMSLVPGLIEVFVRVAYCVKRLCEGHDLAEALPFNAPGRNRAPKLQTMLFTAHLIATGVNVGRVALEQNPMSVNYPEWLAFGKTSLQQLKWALYDKETEMAAHVQASVDSRWGELDAFVAAWGGGSPSRP
jgi:hypothetical protein